MKKILHFLSLTLLLTITFGFKEYTVRKADWLNGNWKGKKYQVDMDRAWDMELKLDAKAHLFAVEYPKLGCKGVLEVVSIGKNKAVFTERMTEGSCIDQGYIIITRTSEKHLSFTCLRDNNERLASYATLEKQP